MEKFLALAPEKQKAIRSAALAAFGKQGYRKASAGDIAAAAGISKGMIFHYFGNKKNLYLYLINWSFEMIREALTKAQAPPDKDFFERILYGTCIKLEVLRANPGLLQFCTSVYFEKNPEVLPEITAYLKDGTNLRSGFLLTDTDLTKFRDTVDPKLVIQILVRFSEGYVSGADLQNQNDLDAMLREFTACMDMMKRNFYKEEYL